MDEITERQRERLYATFIFGDLCNKAMLDMLLIAVTDKNETVEEWALNALRKLGEIKREYKDNQQIAETQKEKHEFLNKAIRFYFENNPE